MPDQEETKDITADLKRRLEFLEALLLDAPVPGTLRESRGLARAAHGAAGTNERNALLQSDTDRVDDALEISAELFEQAELQGLLVTPRLKRIVPVILFLSNDSAILISAAREAVKSLMDALGLLVLLRLPAEFGSFFEKLYSKTKDRLSQQDVTERLKKVERALELKGVEHPQAEVDLVLAKAAHELAKTFDKVEQGVALIGSLCVLKIKNQMAVLTLSQEQMLKLGAHPEWLKNPEVLQTEIFAGRESLPGHSAKI